MNECPQCDKQLRPDGSCNACGWAPTPERVTPHATRRCGECGELRAVERAGDPNTFACACGAISVTFCWACGGRGMTTADEDGQRRCGTCHVAYLKRRMERDLISPGDLARCRATIAAAVDRAGEKWATRRK